MKKWLIFIQERFEPVSHLVMITALFTANTLLAWALSGNPVGDFTPGPHQAAAFAVVVLMYFHLRLFDEIKDYETDKRINPTRPLPRGLIGLTEFKNVTLCVTALELIIAVVLLPPPTVTWAIIMVGYSLLMFKEFFVGAWLSPKMELYAISHTLVSGLMALFICSAATGLDIRDMETPFLFLGLANWMTFNIFEFARKTFAKGEERAEVDSYSKRLGPWGAVALVIANAALAITCLWKMAPYLPSGETLLTAEIIITALLGAAGLLYATKNRTGIAKAYRGIATVYLVLFNVQIVCILL